MDEFMLESHYRKEERDRDSLLYYRDSKSNMLNEMIINFGEDMSGDLNEDEDEDKNEDITYDLDSDIYHNYREDTPDKDLFDNDSSMY
jgi:hypothetical protein